MPGAETAQWLDLLAAPRVRFPAPMWQFTIVRNSSPGGGWVQDLLLASTDTKHAHSAQETPIHTHKRRKQKAHAQPSMLITKSVQSCSSWSSDALIHPSPYQKWLQMQGPALTVAVGMTWGMMKLYSSHPTGSDTILMIQRRRRPGADHEALEPKLPC